MVHALLGGTGRDIALIDADAAHVVTYDELKDLVSARMSELSELAGGLAFLGVRNDVSTVVDYLALTGQRTATALLDPTSPNEVLTSWDTAYEPDAIIGFDTRRDEFASASATELGESVLLTTSGSTGSPKFVRLSHDNIVSNAEQICQALSIDAGQRALAHLPLFYSFGLSVLNSHLLAGATSVLTSAAAIRPEFWDAVESAEVTSLPGVPYSYEMFLRVGLLDKELPHLQHLTQAGGRMSTDRILQIHERLSPKGVSLWVMYGQTEASARISVLPAQELPEHAGTVGVALAGGVASLVDQNEHGVGELVYEGPNVMLGYASSRADLGTVDVNRGRLETGDLASMDDAGRISIRGRLKRIAKLFGNRVSLDDIEARLSHLGVVAAIDADQRVSVFVESAEPIEKLARLVERTLGFPIRSVQAQTVESIPTTAAGKIDYEALREQWTR